MWENAEDLEEFLIPLVAEIVIAACLISVTSGRKRVCEVEVEKPILAAHAAKIKPFFFFFLQIFYNVANVQREECPQN